MINTTISKYKITRLIGEGGMASVYEAEHEMLGTKVAIKVLNPILSANAQIRERFINEAKMMASLNHPNITRVIDFDDQPQHLCIIMEYLEGEDLSQKIKRNGALSDKHINEVFTQILSAFQYAHDKGIVHRDIKPSNIFILPDGQVKILDFGIAKLFGQSNEMTQTGTQIGTPTYMSPEQVKADKTIDHRSDIYSLGVTLYYAVNGKAPYNSTTESQFDIFNKIVYEPLPEISGNSKYNGIIKKACAKNREERFQNCNAWLSELNNPTSAHENIEEATIVENTKSQTITPKEENAQPTSNTTSNIEKEKKKPTGIIIGVIAGLILLVIILIATSGPSKSVVIGNQRWMGTNLNVDHFRNGDLIPEAKTEDEWKRAGENHMPACCYYNNDPANGEEYGKLYNWYAVNDQRGLAPEGWHIPTGEEWTTLTNFLGGEEIAGYKMKSTEGWWENGNGTNESGFNGLPGGCRTDDGSFLDIGAHGKWWYSNFGYGYYCDLNYKFSGDGVPPPPNSTIVWGYSVRCLKD